MQISINIEKRHLFLILAVIVLMAGVVVIAYGGNNPNIMGHTGNEIEFKSGYGDKIILGGDTSGNDLQITIDAPATRNLISFWNSQLNDFADIKAKSVSGGIVGSAQSVCSGNSATFWGCQSAWGGASCTNSCGGVNCPAGSTARAIGSGNCWHPNGNAYCYTVLCIKN